MLSARLSSGCPRNLLTHPRLSARILPTHETRRQADPDEDRRRALRALRQGLGAARAGAVALLALLADRGLMPGGLAALQADLAAFRDARDWQRYHTPEALARAIMVEAGELNDLFLWGREPATAAVAEEMADVLIYCLNLCNALGADAEAIIRKKIAQNATRRVVGDRLLK